MSQCSRVQFKLWGWKSVCGIEATSVGGCGGSEGQAPSGLALSHTEPRSRSRARQEVEAFPLKAISAMWIVIASGRWERGGSRAPIGRQASGRVSQAGRLSL